MKNIYRNENSIILKNEIKDFDTGQLLSIAETQNFVIIHRKTKSTSHFYAMYFLFVYKFLFDSVKNSFSVFGC